ncbi:exopolysaccharide biosynthesis protein [Microcoleus sp. FACHB-831]|uniref:exopolysaccharide biosynthesis protein n=1 Tax=Microcoleus sp. FACHB-831 TaxID=2692827 RepID=UPI0016825050|nr:exopolysaccharide biosynthesis protein [Microcoleus sp. FACHB-831]MBD1922688.1 exopolysaccharide biosynthesis protein [Microcoleus sp. FACHB-831]
MRFSKDINSLLERLASQPLTLAAILAETSERGFSLVIGLLVLPFLFPLPPGLTWFLGGGSLLLAAQMALGRRRPWLPKKIALFQFPPKFTQQLLKNIQKVTGVLEKIARPRLPKVARNRRVWQLNGVCMVWLSILLLLPIPFTNPIPTIGILLFVVATLEGDGLLMCISYGVTALISLFFVFVGGAFWQGLSLLIQKIF